MALTYLVAKLLLRDARPRSSCFDHPAAGAAPSPLRSWSFATRASARTGPHSHLTIVHTRV
jgi:hypothetical protein